MAKSISNSQDIIDSRDVIARIAELEDAVLVCTECGAAMHMEDGDIAHHGDPGDIDHDADADHTALQDQDDVEELRILRELADEASGYASDWHHGEALIRDSYFEKYAQQLADDLHGNEMRNASWPFDYIDWERAADALKMDYTSVDFDGVEYWIRS